MAADGGPLCDQQLPLEELDPHPIISDAKPHICWEKVNEDIWNDIKPIYEDLNQQRLSSEQAEEAFVSSLVSHLFKHGALKTKLPRTNQNKRTRTQSDPKTIQRLKLAKNSARKNLHRDPSTFFNSVRVHNKIIRQQAWITAQRNLLAEEKKFRANRFDFARPVCQGQDQNNPTFSASECYTHFSNQFSNANCTYTCLPYIMPISVEGPFDCSPVLPRHVKAALKRCSSNSKPGANGISYYHLKNLPCTHLFLASLYSKVLLLSNAAPPSWCMGKIVLTHKDGPNSSVVGYLQDLYSKLQAFVLTPDWCTDTFAVQRGVFQGDTLSPIIFLLCFDPVIKLATQHSSKGYVPSITIPDSESLPPVDTTIYLLWDEEPSPEPTGWYKCKVLSHRVDGVSTVIYPNHSSETLDLHLHKWELARANATAYLPPSKSPPHAAVPHIQKKMKEPKSVAGNPHWLCR